MPDRIVHKLSVVNLWHFVWLSFLSAEVFTSIMGLLLKGRVTYDYLVTGGVVSLTVSFAAIYFIKILQNIEKTEWKQAEETIRSIAYYDALTGLPNRILFHDRLTRALAAARRHKHMLCVMLLDMDRFKTINDTLGHNVGDLLLLAVAERLKNCLREADTVSRFGGDEFAVMLPELKQAQDADIVAHKVLRAMSGAFRVEGRELFATTSIGISIFPTDGDSIEALVKNADTAMYKAKELGRNCYRFYSADMNAEALGLLTLENSLRRALERKELLLHYQPQVDLKTGRITGTEALLRWQNPQMGMLLPAEFIPLAEETGLIVPIGEWLICEACKQNLKWQKEGLPKLRIAVNLSVRQFRHKDLLDTVSRILKETGMNPDCLDMELTESTIMQNTEETIALLRSLKALGVHLTIDDFGTGYSSLSYLKYLPMSRLKLDHSFVQGIRADPNNEAISKAVIALAGSMNLKVIAEGVETEEQLEFLRLNKCDEAQGYIFGKPAPAEELTDMLSDNARFPRGSSYNIVP